MELLITIIVLALIFDYINGFHDAANAIATIVSTKVLTPLQAVIWAAFFNFLAFFIAKYLIGDFGIANTVSKTVYEQYITLPVILSGVIAAIIWNLWTWWRGIPSSSSHTLIGGFAGAAIAAYGFGAIQSSVILKIVLFIFLAPVIGMLVAFLFTLIVLNLCRKAHPHTAEKWFKRLQLLSSALFSIGHGLNDSQKVMGIIAAALIAAHSQGIGMGVNNVGDLPDWVAFSCFTAISLGTMSGGWKIVRTMGNRITRVTPLEGLMMGTRCGDIDGGAITYIMKKEGLTPDEMSTLLNKKSGVLGMFEKSSDMRELEDAVARGEERAILTENMYFYRITKYIGAYAAAMDGVDVILFTGGVGENQATARAGVCKTLGYLGVKIDPEKNKVRSKEAIISTDDSKVKVVVIPTDEELMIATDTMDILNSMNK